VRVCPRERGVEMEVGKMQQPHEGRLGAEDPASSPGSVWTREVAGYERGSAIGPLIRNCPRKAGPRRLTPTLHVSACS
jgi:hypothetical protein